MTSSSNSRSPDLSRPSVTTSTLHDDEDKFSCNICLDDVKSPVVTPCGHLYCWPCIFRWIRTQHTTCPVCKSGITQENLIPIYIRGGSEHDPRNTSQNEDVPNRPLGRRIEAPPVSAQNNPTTAQFHGGFATVNASYGFFPSVFGLQFQSYTSMTGRNNTSEDSARQLYLSRILYFLGALVIVCLFLF